MEILRRLEVLMEIHIVRVTKLCILSLEAIQELWWERSSTTSLGSIYYCTHPSNKQ